VQSELEKEVRFLKTYVAIATLVCSVLFLTAFYQQTHKQRFEEIDAERINIVERDGQVKMVISNKRGFRVQETSLAEHWVLVLD